MVKNEVKKCWLGDFVVCYIQEKVSEKLTIVKVRKSEKPQVIVHLI